VTVITAPRGQVVETPIVNMVRRARKKALFEPGDTRQQWKGEAAASFVSTGITSSCVLPTSSAGYWSPSLSCDTTSASEAKFSFGGDFLWTRLRSGPFSRIVPFFLDAEAVLRSQSRPTA